MCIRDREKDLSFVPTDKMVILYYHIPLRDNTGYLNRKKVLDMISRYKKMCIRDRTWTSSPRA